MIIFPFDHRTGLGQPYAMEISKALERINDRMKQAARAEHNRRAALAAAASSSSSSVTPQPSTSTPTTSSSANKRPQQPTDEVTEATKKIKLDPEAQARPASSSSSSALANFNFNELPSKLVTDLIIANLQFFSEAELNSAIAVCIVPKILVFVCYNWLVTDHHFLPFLFSLYHFMHYYVSYLIAFSSTFTLSLYLLDISRFTPSSRWW